MGRPDLRAIADDPKAHCLDLALRTRQVPLPLQSLIPVVRRTLRLRVTSLVVTILELVVLRQVELTWEVCLATEIILLASGGTPENLYLMPGDPKFSDVF